MSGAALGAGPWAHALEVASAAALAGAEVLRAAPEIPPARTKADGSPVTELDLAANRAILARLQEAFPADPILSEESEGFPPPPSGRLWLVDPLDGTRDFLAGTGEYAVHVALVVDGAPMVAAVAWPAAGRLARAVAGQGAEMTGNGRSWRLHVATDRPLADYRTGITRTAPSATLEEFLARTGLRARAEPCGASIKQLRLAMGELDCCITLHGREHLWDTAAPGLIVQEAGGRVTDIDGRPLRYDGAEVRHVRGTLTSAGPHHAELVRMAQAAWPP